MSPELLSNIEKIFEEYDDIDQPINRGDFSTGFLAATEHYDNKLLNVLKKLVRLKEIKDTLGKTGEYEREQPQAWIEARKILEEIDQQKSTRNIGWIDLNPETWLQIARGKNDSGQWNSSEEVLATNGKGAILIGRIKRSSNKFSFEMYMGGGFDNPIKFITISNLRNIENYEISNQ